MEVQSIQQRHQTQIIPELCSVNILARLQVLENGPQWIFKNCQLFIQNM